MSVRELFDPQQLQAVRQATRRAEARTAGEVVTYVVGRCDEYREAWWTGATLGALLAAMAAAGWSYLHELWGVPAAWLVAPPFAGAVAGYALGRFVPPVQRLLVPDETLERRAARRAAEAFLEEEVFATRDRTGVLIFVAYHERRVVILRDAGINAKVDAASWDVIAADLARGIRQRRAAEALVQAVEACGKLLAEHGVERRADDADELANDVRVRDV
ncbi:MAG: hypothetical protein D6696_07170 [Acidobacteria bacterium]|nr:MAG: hypothetical protein D6696_07170 [Acidobacteriota bacterium]